MVPEPPILVVRKGISFWVETSPLAAFDTTRQALREGVYDDALLVDRNGHGWPIVEAVLEDPPSSPLQGLAPWKRYPVRLQLGDRRHVTLAQLVDLIGEVLDGSGGFLEHSSTSPDEIRERAEEASSVAELIESLSRIQ